MLCASHLALKEEAKVDLNLFLMSDAVTARLWRAGSEVGATTCARCWRYCWLRARIPALQELHRCARHHPAALVEGMR